MGKKKTFTKVKCYDHFTTYKKEEDEQPVRCYQYFIGELMGEDDIYLFLRSERTVFEQKSGATRDGEPTVHKVLKSTIIKRVNLELNWEEEKEEP